MNKFFTTDNLVPNHVSTPVSKIRCNPELLDVLIDSQGKREAVDFANSEMEFHREYEDRYNTPLSLFMHTPSPLRQNTDLHSSKSMSQYVAKISDTDANTIHRQRKELQMMINELKERDKELNELVHSHHSQLVAWEADRQHKACLDKELFRTKAALKKRHEKCKLLKERLHYSQNGVQSKSLELENTQLHLHELSQKASQSSSQVEELKDKNNKLQESVKELSAQVSCVQSREQEISTLLRFKDKDIMDANSRIGELTEKLQSTTRCLNEYKSIESTSKSELEKLRSENLTVKCELEKLKSSQNAPVSPGISPADVSNMKQVILHLQKELLIAGEREKRKDSLLELSRSRQDRTEAELNHLRQLYKALQEEMMVLKQKQNSNDDDDDRLSILSVSDIDDTAGNVSLVNSTHKLSLHFSNKPRSNPVRSSLQLLSNPDERHPHQQVPAVVYSADKAADISLTSLESEDIGVMTTGELKSYDLNRTPLNEHDLLDDTLSPTTRLQKLLEESRRMVLSLEKSPTTASMEPTPEKQERRLSP